MLFAASALSLVRLTAGETEALYSFRRASAITTPLYVPDEVIVAFGTGASQSAVEHAVRDVGGVYAQKSQFGGHYLVKLEPGWEERSAEFARRSVAADVPSPKPAARTE